MTIKQLVYTSAQTERAKGYQFVAESGGVSDEDKRIIEVHSSPSKVIPVDFVFGTSTIFFKLTGGKYGLMRMANVGAGFDGRPNTIYTHTLVIPETVLQKFDFNFMAFDKLLKVDKDWRGAIPEIESDTVSPMPPLHDDELPEIMETLKDRNVLAATFDSIISRRTSVLVLDTVNDSRGLLAKLIWFLPSQIRAHATFSALDLGISDRKELSLYVIPRRVGFPASAADVDLVNTVTGSVTVPRPSAYAAFLADRIYDRDYHTIKEFNAFADDYSVTVDNILNLYDYWHEKQGLSKIKELEARVDSFVRLSGSIEPFSKEEAIQHLKKANSYLQKMNDPERLAAVFSEYSRLAEEMGDRDDIVEELQLMINKFLNKQDVAGLSAFIGAYRIPPGQYGGKLLDTVLAEGLDFMENVGVDAAMAMNFSLMNLMSGRLGDAKYLGKYFEICEKVRGQAGERPELRARYLKCRYSASGHLPAEKRLQEYDHLIGEYKGLKMVGEHYAVLRDRGFLLQSTGSETAVDACMEVLTEGRRMGVRIDGDLIAMVDGWRGMKRPDIAMRFLKRVFKEEEIVLAYETSFHIYADFAELPKAYEPTLQNADALGMPLCYYYMLKRVLRDNFGMPADEKDRVHAIEQVDEVLEAWSIAIIETSPGTERFHSHLFDLLRTYLSNGLKVPEKVIKALVKRARTHRKEGEDAFMEDMEATIGDLEKKYKDLEWQQGQLAELREDLTKRSLGEALSFGFGKDRDEEEEGKGKREKDPKKKKTGSKKGGR